MQKEYHFTRTWVAFKSTSYVKDKDGNKIAKISGNFFTMTRKKFIQNMDGENQFMVRNKFWHLIARSGFVFDKEGKMVAKLRKKVLALADHYDIATRFGDITIRGNILGFDYHITLNGTEIGHVARKMLGKDEFVLTLEEGNDPYFYIALVVELDNIFNKVNEDIDND